MRIWKGKKLHILAVENQNYVDYRMVLRNMLSESIGYRKLCRHKKCAHEKTHDLKDRNEYLSGMRKDKEFTPIITLVVYFGTEGSWDGARCSYVKLQDFYIEKPTHTLIVIGNGFDKMHGVPSGYYDFRYSMRKGNNLRENLEFLIDSDDLRGNLEENLARLIYSIFYEC